MKTTVFDAESDGLCSRYIIFNYYYKIIRLQTNYLGLNLTLGILLIITGIATLFKSVLFYLKKVITKLSDNVKIIKRKSKKD